MDGLYPYVPQLKQCPLFRGYTEEQTRTALRLLEARTVKYEKDAFLLKPSEPMRHFGLVVHGRVSVCIDDIEGNTAIMAQVPPGQTFGEALCFLDSRDPDVYVRAAEPSVVVWFSVRALFAHSASSEVRDLEKRFSQMLAGRTLAMNQRIQILSRHTLRQKLIAYFTFCLQNTDSRELQIPMSREELAQYIGADRSALSRELSRMQRDGLITYHKNELRICFQSENE